MSSTESIWKFQLSVIDAQTIMMPSDCKILSVQMQDGVICMWALVNTQSLRQRRIFRVIGTGNPIPEGSQGLSFIATAQHSPFVWHIFEEVA
jgi:hypothetical protein